MRYLGGKRFVAEKCDIECWCRHTLVGRLLGNPCILYRPHNAKTMKTERMFTQETLQSIIIIIIIKNECNGKKVNVTCGWEDQVLLLWHE